MTTLSVILCSHNPNPGRLHRTLAGLRAQTLPSSAWETLLVDNASTPPLAPAHYSSDGSNLRLIRENELGLTAARRRGLHEARGGIIVFTDDDNVLAADYLEQVTRIFAANPTLGAIGGKSLPEFEGKPPQWWKPEFNGLLACRDLGDVAASASDRIDACTGLRCYPHCAPIGAGMALRRFAVQTWLSDPVANSLSDRRGSELTSGGDNDISLAILSAGWKVGYFPDLTLTHLIPSARLQPRYLARLNRGISKSWIQVLQCHKANPWPPIPRWSVLPRQLRSWFVHRAWAGPAEYIRWQGACGHFEGRAAIRNHSRPQ